MWTGKTWALDEVSESFARKLDQHPHGLDFQAIVRKATGELIGLIGFQLYAAGDIDEYIIFEHAASRLTYADTIGKATEFQTFLQAANPAWVGDMVMQGAPPLGIPHFTKILTEFGLPVESGLLTELQGMYARVEQPGAFSAFLHADLCPDNMFFIGDDVRLFDFEGGRFGHALIDASYARILFPTCWCCNRIPQPVVMKMEAAYRTELIRGCPVAADDHLFTQALGDVCGFTLVESLRWWQLPPAPQEDHQWGLASLRTRGLARLEAFIATATEFDLLPYFRNAASQLLQTLQARWPDVEPLPVYPAFRQ